MNESIQLPSSNRGVVALGERLRDELELPTDLDLLLRYREFTTQDLKDIFETLRRGLIGIPGLLSCRVKRLDSLVRKLRRQRSMDIVRMDDIVGYRFIVPSLAALDSAVEVLSCTHSPHRIRDYRVETHNGYRAVHMIFRRGLSLPGSGDPKMYSYELQLRTYYQHLWSSTSESFGEQVKEGGGRPEVRNYLDALSKESSRSKRSTR